MKSPSKPTRDIVMEKLLDVALNGVPAATEMWQAQAIIKAQAGDLITYRQYLLDAEHKLEAMSHDTQ